MVFNRRNMIIDLIHIDMTNTDIIGFQQILAYNIFFCIFESNIIIILYFHIFSNDPLQLGNFYFLPDTLVYDHVYFSIFNIQKDNFIMPFIPTMSRDMS